MPSVSRYEPGRNMNNDQLYTEVKAYIDQYAALSYTDPAGAPLVTRQDQQARAAMPGQPAILLQIVSDRPIGSPSRTFNRVGDTMVWTTRQLRETVVQVTGQADEGGTMFASDMVAWAAALFTLDPVIDGLAAKGVGVLRIVDVRQPHRRDDRDELNIAPSFDLTLRHHRTLKIPVPAVTDIRAGIYRV